MAELKTQQNVGDVDAFLNSVENDIRKRDAFEIKDTMTRLSGEERRGFPRVREADGSNARGWRFPHAAMVP